ncbi:MAG: TolC family protein [Phocaeicola sp.]
MKRYRSPLHWFVSAIGLMLIGKVTAQVSAPVDVAPSHHSRNLDVTLSNPSSNQTLSYDLPESRAALLHHASEESVTVSQRKISLSEALQLGVANYETIQAKALQVEAAQAEYKSSQTLYLPEVTLSAQQFYGTANALHGPQYGFGEGTISMGAPQAAQNWEAAFSSLYTANLNWNIYSFGARSSRVNLTKNRIERSQAELDQALFEHQIKIASAYFDLVAIEEIVRVQVANVGRAEVLVSTVNALVESGIRPGVELSTAEAELANTQIALLKAEDQHVWALKELVLRMGVEYQSFRTDGLLTTKRPMESLLVAALYQKEEGHIPNINAGEDREFSKDTEGGASGGNSTQKESTLQSVIVEHPALRSQDAAIEESRIQTKFYKADGLPKLNVVGSVAARGSGFKYNYAQDRKNLSSSYLDGVGIDRSNYLVGVNLSWSVTSLFKNRSLSRAERKRTEALIQQRSLASRQLTESYRHATQKRMLTEQQYQAVLKQVDAATQSYQQYENLYGNGLAVIDDLISSIYNLARAESECAVIQVNLWHAYLMQVASSGEIEPLLQQIE